MIQQQVIKRAERLDDNDGNEEELVMSKVVMNFESEYKAISS